MSGTRIYDPKAEAYERGLKRLGELCLEFDRAINDLKKIKLKEYEWKGGG